jgi:hypothetical protein
VTAVTRPPASVNRELARPSGSLTVFRSPFEYANDVVLFLALVTDVI